MFEIRLYFSIIELATDETFCVENTTDAISAKEGSQGISGTAYVL